MGEKRKETIRDRAKHEGRRAQCEIAAELARNERKNARKMKAKGKVAARWRMRGKRNKTKRGNRGKQTKKESGGSGNDDAAGGRRAQARAP